MLLRRTLVGMLIVLVMPATGSVRAADPPAWLPRYDVTMDMDLEHHYVHVTMRATWTNPHTAAARELVFNAHSRYVVPDSEIGLTAKTLEIFRMYPGEGMGEKEPALEVQRATLVDASGPGQNAPLSFSFEGDTKTTLVLPLPFEVKPGQSVTVALDMIMHLPQKQGRWGQWRGVTFLSNWLPVFAVFGPPPPPPVNPEKEPLLAAATCDPCWQPTPFVAWHQPFFNEAGHYRVHVTLPDGEHVACTGTVVHSALNSNGLQELEIHADGVRDFAFLCSARYVDYRGEAEVEPGRSVPIHVLAFPEHEHYAREMVRVARAALTTYSAWFGPYRYPEFTIAEAFFGWNGNECGALVMIDERIFDMPHLAGGYVELLVSHEICHQWWYNAVGTNGYCETWMDEGLATYFAHRLLDHNVSFNNKLMSYPRGLEWLPNIRREDYRAYSFYGTLGRGENSAVVQPMPNFEHVVNLFSMCYDKGSRIVGMIESRMGPASFLSFVRRIQERYGYRILRVADFQRELEEYTGHSWEEFFHDWLYTKGLSDWALEKVEIKPRTACALAILAAKPQAAKRGVHVVVHLHQKAENDEQTLLGIALPGDDGYSIRIPIALHGGNYLVEEPNGLVTVLGDGKVRVEVDLPDEPTQIAVDPDQVLIDKNPANNFWKTPIRWRFTPVYTFLEETDLTNAYDRWNFIFGPWVYSEAYNNPWYDRTPMIGLRAGAYRTQQFTGGVYAAYRPETKDAVVGVEGLWDHWPDCHYQVGFNAERRLTEQMSGDNNAFRAVLYGRYVFQYGDSLYLPPMHFVETFVKYEENFLPDVKTQVEGGERFDLTATAGVHYRLDYRTPYWDPEGGFLVDAAYENGLADLLSAHSVQKFAGELAFVQSAPNLSAVSERIPALRPVLDWFADSRFAFRGYGAVALPTRGEFFSLGGGNLFRGFDTNERQGSAVWVASAEWRMPLLTGLHYNAFDRVIGLRNVFGAAFCDVGDTYIRNHQVGPVAYAVGGGLRFDVAWFSFVERSLLRIDVAKTVNENSGVQVWFDVQVPF